MDRPFGLWTAVSMVVGFLVGAGIFVLPSSLGQLGWTAAIGWLVVGTGVMGIARVMVQLNILYPKEPSVMTIAGDILGLFLARMIAWSYWFGLVVAAALLPLAAAGYFLYLWPSAPLPGWVTIALSLIILGAITLINLRGAVGAGKFQVATTLLKLIPLVLVLGIIAYVAFATPEIYTKSPAEPLQLSLLTPALGVIFFAALGFEGASLVAQRISNLERNIVPATMYGLLVVLVIFFIASMGIVLATPGGELQNASAPFATFASTFAGSWAGQIVALFAAVSAIGCLNAVVMIIGDVPFAMVRDGQLPTWMAPGNEQQVGQRPILVGAGIATIIILMSTSGFGAQVVDFLLRLTTAATIWFFAGICLAALKIGAQRALSVLGLGFCVWVLYGTGSEASLLGMALMAVGALLHFLIGGRTRPRGSVPAS